MNLRKALPLLLAIDIFPFAAISFADNPLILDQFTADPTARVFDNQIYLYPSHDIPAPPGQRADWFCMADYHVFSSKNLLDWQDHGVIVSQDKVDWIDANSYSMWAPDCVCKDGKYYFYFPSQSKPSAAGGKGQRMIGVAIADSPAGPFTPQPKPIEGIDGIDPCVLIDHDGQAYLYAALGRMMVAKLKSDLLELDSSPQTIANLPTVGLVEGPFVFERNGIYYLTYPHVENKTERLEYAMGKSPLGPFTVTGVIMDESPSGCWTNHHSIVQYQGQWILFYHDQDLSPTFDKNRSVRADYLTFNDDGTINKVIPTFRGVGVADATRKIQIDRYSAISNSGVAVGFVDEAKKQEGWKVTLAEDGAWVRYDRVDCSAGGLKSIRARANTSSGGTIEVRLDRVDGPPVTTIDIAASADWKEIQANLTTPVDGVHDFVVSLKDKGPVDLDWIRFE